MHEGLDELFAAASADLATRTRPPGAEQVIATTRRRTTAVVVGAAAAAATVAVTAFALLGGGRMNSEPEPAPAPSSPAPLAKAAAPVWFDSDGLHRGDVVEQTAVSLTDSAAGDGAFTLVRAGALYQSQDTRDIWFHPWGGEPRIVGHARPTGAPFAAGGDRNGDNAAWFEGDELVVYDTRLGRELARMATEPAAEASDVKVVTPEKVVWERKGAEGAPLLQLDLETLEISELADSRVVDQETPYLADLQGDVEMWAYGDAEYAFCCGPADLGGLVVRSPGHEERRYPAFISPAGSLSPDGRFLGGWTGAEDRGELGGISGVGVVDVDTGEYFELPGGPLHGRQISWIYGATAMVRAIRGSDGEGPEALYVCDVAARECDRVPTSGAVILPS